MDLFCGAGGAAMGYHRAGFDVIGVDIKPQPRYPFRFVQDDAMRLLERAERWRWSPLFHNVAAIHASPPCQAYSTVTRERHLHPDLYEPTRDALTAIGLPWVIENVIGSPYRSGVVLCGSMFGMRIRRHRNFESSHVLFPPSPCRHREQGVPLGVYGHGGGTSVRPSGGSRGVKATPGQYGELMGMPWAVSREVVLAIPPAYTEHIGGQLLAVVEAHASS